MSVKVWWIAKMFGSNILTENTKYKFCIIKNVGYCFGRFLRDPESVEIFDNRAKSATWTWIWFNLVKHVWNIKCMIWLNN